jgi:hypothetical protein
VGVAGEASLVFERRTVRKVRECVREVIRIDIKRRKPILCRESFDLTALHEETFTEAPQKHGLAATTWARYDGWNVERQDLGSCRNRRDK